MTEAPDQEARTANAASTPSKRKKLPLWKKIGGGSLSVSVIFHAILLVIALFWILRIVPPPPEKSIDFMPPSGGGGSPDSDSRKEKQRVRMMRPNLSRVAAIGATSNLSLPEPDALSEMTRMASLSSGGLSAGLGGKGSGGGRGDGKGTGIGNGFGPGIGTGGGLANPFGMIDPNKGALVGTFYDFKQTRDAKPTDISVNEVVTLLNEFTGRGWRDATFNKYFRADQELYQSKLYIPAMAADRAPAAFNCADKAMPSRWAVVYRGMVTPPRSGKYRFVGCGDDILVVRFNGKNVFDYGYYSGTTPIEIHRHVPVLKEETENEEIRKIVRRGFPMEQPLKTYRYDTTPNFNQALGGLAVGIEFTAQVGKSYPIEILMSELPGGLFCASLMIEETGAGYSKTPGGSPILPLFRLDNSVPPPTTEDNAPPYDPSGPIWKVTGQRSKPDI